MFYRDLKYASASGTLLLPFVLTSNELAEDFPNFASVRLLQVVFRLCLMFAVLTVNLISGQAKTRATCYYSARKTKKKS